MFRDKRGVSNVIAVILLILITILAVVILWMILKPLIQRGTEYIGFQFLTLNLDIEKAEVFDGQVEVKIKRGAGESQLDKIKIVLKNNETQVYTTAEGLKELETKTFSFGLNISNPKIAEIYPVMIKDGKEKVGKLADSCEIEIVALSVCGNGFCEVDEDTTNCPEDCCRDIDGDGYNQSSPGCGIPDCDDTNSSINPGAVEICNNIDDNCDLQIDEGIENITTDVYGFNDVGECRVQIESCVDGNFIIIQEAVEPENEICDGLDNDCDTLIDEEGVCVTGPYINPNGDVTTEWEYIYPAGGTHESKIDEINGNQGNLDINDYILGYSGGDVWCGAPLETGYYNDEFNMETFTVDSVSAIKIWAHGDEDSGEGCSLWANIKKDDVWQTQQDMNVPETQAWMSVTFSGLSWTQTNLDNLQVRLRMCCDEAEADGTVRINAMYAEVTYD